MRTTRFEVWLVDEHPCWACVALSFMVTVAVVVPVALTLLLAGVDDWATFSGALGGALFGSLVIGSIAAWP